MGAPLRPTARRRRTLPQLVVIMEEKWLHAALNVFDRLGLRGRWPGRHRQTLEELYFPSDPVPLRIDKTDTTLKVIKHARRGAPLRHAPPRPAKQAHRARRWRTHTGCRTEGRSHPRGSRSSEDRERLEADRRGGRGRGADRLTRDGNRQAGAECSATPPGPSSFLHHLSVGRDFSRWVFDVGQYLGGLGLCRPSAGAIQHWLPGRLSFLAQAG